MAQENGIIIIIIVTGVVVIIMIWKIPRKKN